MQTNLLAYNYHIMSMHRTQRDRPYIISFNRIINVRTYTSDIHKILNRLFERVEIMDNSSDKYIASQVRIHSIAIDNTCDKTIFTHNNGYNFTELSYTHFHSINFDPYNIFIIKRPNKTIRYDTEYVDGKRLTSNRTS